MNYRKHGAKLLGLLAVAVLGTMALAASAQAVTPGFLIGGKAVGALLATVGAVQEGTGTLLVGGGLHFEINCTAFAVDEGHLASNTDGKAVLLYTGCTALEFEPVKGLLGEIHCHVAEPIKAEALVLPAELKNGEPAVLAEKIKALIRLWLPSVTEPLKKECLLPNDNTVTGELCLKVRTANDPGALETNDTTETLIFTNDEIQGLCRTRVTLEGTEPGGSVEDLLKYGGQDVFVDGKAELFLTGAHNGMTLGVSLY